MTWQGRHTMRVCMSTWPRVPWDRVRFAGTLVCACIHISGVRAKPGYHGLELMCTHVLAHLHTVHVCLDRVVMRSVSDPSLHLTYTVPNLQILKPQP